MTITQTIDIPDTRQITLNVPREIPVGRTIIAYTPAPAVEPHPCPLCREHQDPVTGELRYNAETIASMEEADAIERGEIPAKRFNSLEELLEDLRS